jgi:hypothetical protein
VLEEIREEGNMSNQAYYERIGDIDKDYRDSIHIPILAFTKELFDREFVIIGSKYPEFNHEQWNEINNISDNEYFEKKEELESVYQENATLFNQITSDDPSYIERLIDLAKAYEDLTDYTKKYEHLFPCDESSR